MKKLILLILIVGAAVGAAFTCPDKAAHKKALLRTANVYVNDKVDDAVGTKGIGGAIGKGLKAVKQVVGAPAASLIINQYLEVEDYYLFSLGKINKGGESKVVSLGIFGQVITPTTDMIDKAMKK